MISASVVTFLEMRSGYIILGSLITEAQVPGPCEGKAHLKKLRERRVVRKGNGTPQPISTACSIALSRERSEAPTL